MAIDLQKDEPEFKFTTTAGTAALTSSAKQNTIAVATNSTTTGTKFVAVAYMTKTDECWVAKDTAQSGVKYGFVTPSTGTKVTASVCKPTVATAAVTWSTTNGWPGAPAGH